jgi:hypothetical protein
VTGGGGVEWVTGGGGVGWVGVGVTVEMGATVGAEELDEPKPVLELGRLVTGLETCVDACAGALAGA